MRTGSLAPNWELKAFLMAFWMSPFAIFPKREQSPPWKDNLSLSRCTLAVAICAKIEF